MLWQAWGNALFGYVAWAWLLARHPAATISPFALLVPVSGMATAAWMLGEPLPPWKLGAALLVLTGARAQRAVAAVASAGDARIIS